MNNYDLDKLIYSYCIIVFKQSRRDLDKNVLKTLFTQSRTLKAEMIHYCKFVYVNVTNISDFMSDCSLGDVDLSQ